MILTAENISFSRGERLILRDVSFSLSAGQACLLKGPNGAGKTTLIRTLAGFLSPDAGTIDLEGDKPDHGVGEQCHYIGHTSASKAALTARENLAFWAAYLSAGVARAEQKSNIDNSLERFGLTALSEMPAGMLSQGQKRRLGLARLLVAKRPVWLLDEPTVSLDAGSTEALAGLIEEHTASGGIVLAATHLPLGFAGTKTLELSGGKAVLS